MELAAAGFLEAGRLRPLDAWTTRHQVATLLAAGNRDGLRIVASGLLDRFRQTTDPSSANNVAWSLVLAPVAVADLKTPVSLAEIALAGSGSARMLDTHIRNTLDLFDRDPKARQILEKLDEPITMPFATETPLDDILKYVKQATSTPTYPGIPIYIDPVGLQRPRTTLRSSVKIDLEGVPLRTTLRLLLK